MRTAFVLLIAAGALTAAPVPKDFKKTTDDKALIVGTWIATEPGSACFQFAADGTLKTWHQNMGGGARHSEMGWTWVIVDAKASPKKAKLNRAENPAAFYDCIYELNGDTLKFALITNPGNGLPETVVPHRALQLHTMARATDK